MHDIVIARLWNDGHGIERIPVTVDVAGALQELLVVRRDELLALEAAFTEMREVLACVNAGGIDWDDPAERARLFVDADALWERIAGVARGDEPMLEDDGGERPQ